jgi:hypothetical protein
LLIEKMLEAAWTVAPSAAGATLAAIVGRATIIGAGDQIQFATLTVANGAVSESVFSLY